MSSRLLVEYRCTCGKLLFKGLLCEGCVQVKCRRCGALQNCFPKGPRSWSRLESDADGLLVGASGNIGQLFEGESDGLLGRRMADILPVLRDQDSARAVTGYQLKDTVVMLRDGSAKDVETCIVPRSNEAGAFLGYRVYAVRKEA